MTKTVLLPGEPAKPTTKPPTELKTLITPHMKPTMTPSQDNHNTNLTSQHFPGVILTMYGNDAIYLFGDQAAFIKPSDPQNFILRPGFTLQKSQAKRKIWFHPLKGGGRGQSPQN